MMNRPIEWIEKTEEGEKRKVRVTFFAKGIIWQFQNSREGWDYDRKPSLEDWEKLLDEVQRRYQRRRATHKELLLTEKSIADFKRESI
jgi:hypothetical protein